MLLGGQAVRTYPLENGASSLQGTLSATCLICSQIYVGDTIPFSTDNTARNYHSSLEICMIYDRSYQKREVKPYHCDVANDKAVV
jgi:hypothetical protein